MKEKRYCSGVSVAFQSLYAELPHCMTLYWEASQVTISNSEELSIGGYILNVSLKDDKTLTFSFGVEASNAIYSFVRGIHKPSVCFW